jgi:hypothetical protein
LELLLCKIYKEEIMGSGAWKALHRRGRQNQPGINEIIAFLPGSVAALFKEFSQALAREYDVACRPPAYTETDGWAFSFGRYGISLLNHVSMEDGAFSVQGLRVDGEASFQKALELAASLHNGYRERFERNVAAKKEKQNLNTQKSRARERGELEAMAAKIDRGRFNRYRWPPKLSRQTLKRLYESDAKGFQDLELADDAGFTLYARCLQGRDERLLIESGKLKCHHCAEILQARGKNLLIECLCGQQYLFRDYMRSFRRNNMPTGGAAAIFNKFIEDWPRAKGYAEKMRIIDWLVHEFHINLNSGVKGRFVGINLIDGTKKQIGGLILELAHN